MKKILITKLLILITILSFSQSNLNNGYLYSFIDGIPTADDNIKTNFNDFKFEKNINHFLDKESGALTCDKEGNHNIEIKLDNIGRLIFYTKTIFENSDELNSSLGNYIVNFFRDEKLILSEKRDLSQNWTEFHININEYKINKVSIEFNPTINSGLIAIDKIKIRTFTSLGVNNLKKIFDQNILLKTVGSDIQSQKLAIIDLSVNNIKTLIYYYNKLDDVNTFIEGEKLGTSRQKALNPFNYPQFNQLYLQIVTNASRAEKLKLDNIKIDIEENNWVNVIGNVTNVLTNGMFSSLINSLKNIVNNGITIDNKEIIVLNGKLYQLSSSGKLKIIQPDSDIDIKYSEIHKKYSDYIKFIEILSSKQLIEINEEEKFDFTRNKTKFLKIEILALLSDIISEANLTLEDGHFKGELDSETLVSNFKTNFSVSATSFLNSKIRSEINNTKNQNISSNFYEFISGFKTYYDNKYSKTKLNPNALDELNISKQIKSNWKKNLETISEQYINSVELTKLKSLTK